MDFEILKQKIARTVRICIAVTAILIFLCNVLITHYAFKQSHLTKIDDQNKVYVTALNSYFGSIESSAYSARDALLSGGRADISVANAIDYIEGIYSFYYKDRDGCYEYILNNTNNSYTRMDKPVSEVEVTNEPIWNAKENSIMFELPLVGDKVGNAQLGIILDMDYLHNFIESKDYNNFGKAYLVGGQFKYGAGNIKDDRLNRAKESVGGLVKDDMAACRRLNNGMYAMTIGNNFVLTNSMMYSFVSSFIVTLVGIIMAVAFMHVQMTHAVSPYYNKYIGSRRVIDALTNCYFATLVTDLKDLKLDVVNVDESNVLGIDAHEYRYDLFAQHLLEHISEDYRDVVSTFIDINNARDRLCKSKLETKDCKTIDDIWVRITLSAVYENNMRDFNKIVIAVSDINAERAEMDRMEIEAEHDKLTGLLNRHGMDKVISNLNSRQPVGLIALDIDKFKGINDTYGHDMGDLALRRLADCLKVQFRRESDYIIRQGGDEFIVIMAGSEINGYDSIRKKIGGINKFLADQSNDPLDGKILPNMSISAGVAYSSNGYRPELAKNADEALYNTKERGRNGCNLYETVIGNNRHKEFNGVNKSDETFNDEMELFD